jgi:hypothetical protein
MVTLVHILYSPAHTGISHDECHESGIPGLICPDHCSWTIEIRTIHGEQQLPVDLGWKRHWTIRSLCAKVLQCHLQSASCRNSWCEAPESNPTRLEGLLDSAMGRCRGKAKLNSITQGLCRNQKRQHVVLKKETKVVLMAERH